MSCTINGFTFSDRVGKSIYRVAEQFIGHEAALAGFLVSEDFRNYFISHTDDTRVVGNNTFSDDYSRVEEWNNVNQNLLRKVLRDYFKRHYRSVENSTTKSGDEQLNGFTSMAAKTVAKKHTADVIKDIYSEEIQKPRKARRSNVEIIDEANDVLTRKLFTRVDNFTNDIITGANFSEEAKKDAGRYKRLVYKLNKLRRETKDDSDSIRQLHDEFNRLTKEVENAKVSFNNAKQAGDKANMLRINQQVAVYNTRRKEINNEVKDIQNKIKAKRESIGKDEIDRLVSAQNLIMKYAKEAEDTSRIRLQNYCNLVQQARANSNEWYFLVFNTKEMTSIVKDFENIGDLDEYFEGQDLNEDTVKSKWNGETVDETTKSWEDNLYKSVNQSVSSRIRLSLSKVPKLTQPFNPNITSRTDQALDTNNELGVSTYMNSQHLINQIYSKSKVTNREAFVNSIIEMSNKVSELHGLGQIAHIMRRNKAFLNEMFAAFSKPKIKKVMLTIRDIKAQNSIVFDYSNSGADAVVATMYLLSNKMRATYINAYDKKDLNNLDTKEGIIHIMNKYFPNIKNKIYDRLFNEADEDFANNLSNVATALSDIIKEAGKMKDTINATNDAYTAEYLNARKKYNERIQKGESVEKPVRKYARNYDVDLTATANKALIKLSEIINHYQESPAKLQTANAEGNTSADIMKNSWVTRFADAVEANEEENDNAGLKNLLSYFIQGENKYFHNQYFHNPLLFGLKDRNGIELVPGMFNHIGNGQFEINANAKEMFKLNLFDGTKNAQNNDGQVYATMNKLDFFITQFFAYMQSTKEMTNDKLVSDINGFPTAQYAMRIGSDAPKIFFVRSMKYNVAQVQNAFYNHLLNEINIACKGLNSVFVQDADNHFVVRDNTFNLLDRILYNGSIVKDGKLTGNAFKFNRLFDVVGYKASEQIENVLSLYGQGGLVKDGGNGNLYIDLSDNNSPIKHVTHTESDGTTYSSFELNLTDEIKDKLMQIVVDWYNAYEAEINQRTNKFTKAMRDNGINFNQSDLINFVMNSANMDITYDDIFEGDFKFYKDPRDFLKRTKESQAGGESYSNYNVTESFVSGLHNMTYEGEEEIISYYSTDNSNNVIAAPIKAGNQELRTPIYINGQFKNKPLVARNGFRAITIYNTVTAIDGALQMKENLKSYYIKQGIREELAERMADKIAAGFGFNSMVNRAEMTKVNDAQSYITLEEFIRRKYADGTINDYKALLDQILDPNVKAEDINLDEINARIQVQKNFYYDKVFDETSGLYYPRQIKNAEFVLIPKLLPEGSELRGVYDWMRKNDIGQLNTAETSKAGKKNIFTIWDRKTGELSQDFINVMNDQGTFEEYVETYEYKYLYKQQDVPEHMSDEKNKAGIQIMKKIIDNIYNELEENSDDAEIRERRQRLISWANDYQAAYTANIREDYQNFLDMMGWKVNDNGKIINKESRNDLTSLNFSQFYIRAREEAARLGMDSNFIEYLISNELTGHPNMPNYMNTVASKLESIAQSMFNSKITRQTLPGWHAAQITGVGYSRKLNFDVETGVMEVMIPRWSNLIPKDYDISKLAEEGLDIHLGYRIPTEGKQSISVLRVVGFVPEAFGSTIVVPDAWVTQTGSDFDVDSIYGISWEITTEKQADGSYKLKKVPFEEYAVDDQDLYIDYVNRRLEHSIKKDKLGRDIDDAVSIAKAELDSERDSIREQFAEKSEEFNRINEERNIIWDNLPESVTDVIKGLDANEKTRLIEENKARPKDKQVPVKDIKIDLTTHNPRVIEVLEGLKAGLSNDEIEVINKYQDKLQQQVDIINVTHGITKFDYSRYRTEIGNAVRNTLEGSKDKYFRKVQEAAAKAGINSYSEFLAKPFVERLNRKGRNNLIIDRMIKIMQDETSREEQYGRSQFSDITNANKLVDELKNTKNSVSRSPYNPLDQLDYFEDVMAGARLKALSVNWDTFGSKVNRVRAELSDDTAISFILTVGATSAEGSNIVYDENIIKDAYRNNIEEITTTVPDNTEDEKAVINYNFQHKIAATKNGITKQYGVIIDLNLKQHVDAFQNKYPNGIIAYRVNFKYNTAEEAIAGRIGNPFSELTRGENTVEQFYTWLVTGYNFGNEKATKEYRTAIVNKLLNTDSNSPILYYTELNRPSHATVIGYLIKHKELLLGEWKQSPIKGFIETTDSHNTKILQSIDNKVFYKVASGYLMRQFINNGYNDNKYYKVYDKNPKELEIYNYLWHDIIPEYKDADKTLNKKQFIFKANRIGWSNNNRNVEGRLVTPYMAETTPHHLDAVKEGSVENVNEYTFSVYKLMSGLGIDYETIISFIRQPAISTIVEQDNIANSVFFKSNINQVQEAIKTIVHDLGLTYPSYDGSKQRRINEDSSFYNVLTAIHSDKTLAYYIEQLSGVNLDYQDAQNEVISDPNNKDLNEKNIRKFTFRTLNNRIRNIKLNLNKQQLFDRLKQEGGKKPVDDVYQKIAFDVCIALTFDNIRRGAERVNAYINPLSADKFGAKQSIRETREAIEEVEKLRKDLTISKDGISLMELIYPSTGRESQYGSINEVFSLATVNSYRINRELFITESNNNNEGFDVTSDNNKFIDFVTAEKLIRNILHHKFTDAEYKEYKRYAIAYLYALNNKLSSPLRLNNLGQVEIDTQSIDKARTELGNTQNYWDAEYSRILGYGIDSTGDFDIVDINNPSEELGEISRFNKLTPAQKVMFIQKHFEDNAGIFDYINVTSYNPYDVQVRGINRQYLNYTDQVDDVEDLLYLFRQAFNNHNLLIKMTAIDLVKYAFIAEGFNFKSGYISKIVPNSVLYNDVANGGLDIINNGVDGIDDNITKLPAMMVEEEFIDNYVRSHSNILKVVNMPNWPNAIKDKKGVNVRDQYTGDLVRGTNSSTYFRSAHTTSGVVYINASNGNEMADAVCNKLRLNNNVGGYVKVHYPISEKESVTTIFKVYGAGPVYNTHENGEQYISNYRYYFLAPMNLLDANENLKVSYNKRNNKFATSAYYREVITNLSNEIDWLDNYGDIASINTTLSNSYEAVSNYSPVEGYDINDVTTLDDAYENAEPHLQGSVRKLVNGIINHYKSDVNMTVDYVQFQPFNKLSNLIPRDGVAYKQNITTPYGIVTFEIKNQPFYAFAKGVTARLNDKTLNRGAYSEAIAELEDTKTNLENAYFYTVKLSKESKQDKDDNARFATTEMIRDEAETKEIIVGKKRDNIDNVTKLMMDEINYRDVKEHNRNAREFTNTMRRNGISRNSLQSRQENKDNIFSNAARYYQATVNYMLNRAESYPVDDITNFDIADPALYEWLTSHDEAFPTLAKFILDGVTFGNRISPIFDLNLIAEDESTRDSANIIINNINRVKQNEKFKIALKYIFNIYMKKFSSNPDIVNGILDVREAFGDIDFIDMWITNPSEIQNNQSQIVLKKVKEVLNKAEMFDAKEAQAKWFKDYDDIMNMSGSIDMDKIIDSRQGKLKSLHTDKFEEDRNNLYNKVKEVRVHMRDSVDKFKEYVLAKYDYDKFMLEHTNQELIDDYYIRDLAYRKKVMNEAGDIYFNYMYYTDKLYNTKTDDISAETIREKEQIRQYLTRLKSRIDIDGSLKELGARKAATAINEFLENRKALNKEYFEYQEYEGFKEDYNNYNNYIKRYNKANPMATLEEKLTDVGYKEAFYWIRRNATVTHSEEMKDKLAKAFKLLRGSNSYMSKQIRNGIKTIPGAIDEAGIIDARKLNDEQLEMAKKADSSALSINYDDGLGEAILIKAIPTDIPPLLRVARPGDEEAKQLISGITSKDVLIKQKIIEEINNILIKAVNTSTGELSMNLFFDDNVISNDEREHLINMYNDLRAADANKIKYKSKNVMFEEKVSDQWGNHYSYYLSMTNAAKQRQFRNIFMADVDGDLTANPYIYNYKVPTEKYTDYDKANARKFIADSIRFVTTRYYDLATRDAMSKGNDYFRDWYRKNHVFNPYTHKFEPLSVWKTIEDNPGSEYASSVDVHSTFNNQIKIARESKKNRLYSDYSNNYKVNPDNTKYDSGLNLNVKEQAMRELFIKTLTENTHSHKGKMFVNKGYLPRDRQKVIDAAYVGNQALSIIGASWHSGSDSQSFSKERDYTHDAEIEETMLSLLKGKGTREYIARPERYVGESDEAYNKRLENNRKVNEDIRKSNEAIDNAMLNKNWREVMGQFVHNANINNSKESIKPYLYLLLEDLKQNNAHMLKGYWNRKVITDNKGEQDYADSRKQPLDRVREIMHNMTRRLVFGQYHENSTPRTIANLMQNLTSAKYMIFNVYGGIANVAIGETNIGMERKAKEYFGTAEFLKANAEYLSNGITFITNMYSEKADNETDGFVKFFDVVDFDQVLQFGAGQSGLNTNITRLRNWMYGLQSGGEHIMQNTVLLAMLDSHRVFTNSRGQTVIGSLNDYTVELENQAMKEAIKGNTSLEQYYELFMTSVTNNLQKKYDITSGRKDYNREFLNSIRYNTAMENTVYNNIRNAYNAKRKELTNRAEKDFKDSGNKTVRSLFKLVDGRMQLIDNTKEMQELIAGFRQKVIDINQKIHGVYDKNGAAMLEKTWWGSLAMQYHKHLYTGIMKRWRRRGYHSEVRGTKERGSYQALIDFLSTEFEGINNEEANAIQSIQNVMKAAINTIVNANLNWNNLSRWEQNNIKRNLADLNGILFACAVAFIIHAMWDDDEIKDSNTLSSLMYCADRMYSEASMYMPQGMVTETKTLWSSPIAAGNGPSDLLRGMQLIQQYLLDPNYKPTYSTGLYKGQNKLSVLVRRNIPGVRPFDRIRFITNNNQYYKIGSTQVGLNIAVNLGDAIND